MFLKQRRLLLQLQTSRLQRCASLHPFLDHRSLGFPVPVLPHDVLAAPIEDESEERVQGMNPFPLPQKPSTSKSSAGDSHALSKNVGLALFRHQNDIEFV